MSEEQAPYFVPKDELQEAMDLSGKGYERPAVTIEPPHAVMELRGSEFKEVVIPAFVKISTDFKKRLAEVDEISLKVWLFIALSVNRYSGKANPGLRTIAKGTGFAVNTVQAALKRLENDYLLLTVDRESKKFNIYEPKAFVSANHSDPVSPDDTPPEAVSGNQESVLSEGISVSAKPSSVSFEGESVSPWLILNQRTREPEKQKEPEESTNLKFDYWENLMEYIRDDRSIPRSCKEKIAQGVPVAFEEKVLVIKHPDAEWAAVRFSSTLNNRLKGLCAGAVVKFAPLGLL